MKHDMQHDKAGRSYTPGNDVVYRPVHIQTAHPELLQPGHMGKKTAEVAGSSLPSVPKRQPAKFTMKKKKDKTP